MAVDGTYKIEIDTPMGKQEATITLKTAADKLSGTIESIFGTMDFSGGTVKSNAVAWSMEISSPIGNLKLDCSGKVSGNDISGEVKAGDFGIFPFKGRKV